MDRQEGLAERIGAIAQSQRLTVAVVESLTGGLIATRLAAATDASNWFRGGVVAYANEVKHGLLQLPDGPVVSAQAARTMAENGAALLGADLALAVTGVGGPDPQDDQPPGTVFVCLYHRGQHWPLRLTLQADDPGHVCRDTCTTALELLDGRLTGLAEASTVQERCRNGSAG
jgi:nicotinamide-nucleotide amidase